MGSSNANIIHYSKETDEELDYSFVGTICFHTEQDAVNWVIDTGPTNHMTSLPNCLFNSKSNYDNCYSKLPNGTQVLIPNIGDLQLCNDLILKDTLVVPTFKYNLLCMSKLCKDNNCVAIFHDKICLIQDCATRKLKGVSEHRGRL